MTPAQEIESLKTQISTCADAATEAQLLLELLRKYAALQSPDTAVYVERLMALAAELKSDRYRGWALCYLAGTSFLETDYDKAIELNMQAAALLKTAGDTAGVGRVYNNTGVAYERKGDYNEAMKYHQQALEMRRAANDKAGIAGSYNNMGVVEHWRGNFAQALKIHTEALQLYEELGDEVSTAQSLSNLGNVYMSLGNYPETMKNYLLALQKREALADRGGVSQTYNNMGVLFELQAKYPEALKSHRQALEIRLVLEDKRQIAYSLNNIGLIQFHMKRYDEALQNHLAALELMEALGFKFGIAYCYNNIGNVYSAFSENQALPASERNELLARALDYHLRAMHIREAIEDRTNLAYTYAAVGEICSKQGDHKKAIAELLKAYEIGRSMGAKDVLKQSALALVMVYKAAGDYDNALKYHEIYHRVDSELLGEQAQKQLIDLNFQHKLEQKEKQLEIEQLRNVDLKLERDRSESLLLNILPAEVAKELKEKGMADARLFDDVTVLFTDFVSFTNHSENLTPQQLVDELHTCFSAFDDIISKYNIEKIKTVGDAYLAVSGLPLSNRNHAHDVVKAAIEIRNFMLQRSDETARNNTITFEVRIGVHSGSVVAGIVGVKKFAYDIWGDTVNTAARMEQNSLPGKINISQSTYDLLDNKFTCHYRGEIEAKNKGRLKMYFVEE